MSTELEQIWSQVQVGLRSAVPASTYRIWLEPLRPHGREGSRLVVVAPAEIRAWVSDRFGELLERCVGEVLGEESHVDVVAPKTPFTPGSRRGHEPGPPGSPPAATAFNPKLTFEQFVIGDANRLAHAAALAVAELPAQAYNPLFIYGPPGLGKTHLLHSIANYVATYARELTVLYTTAESFTNEFLSALHSGSVSGFKTRFRHNDILLIDDVQFLERKTKTEEEFFHTFNALHEIGSQLVLTSDRLPSDLAALEDRLRERFEAGLVTDVGPPDLVTRLTILRKRVAHDHVRLAEPEVLQVIAERVSANVRALEGALIRVVAFSSLTGQPITARLAGDVLDGLYPSAAPATRRTISDVKSATCEVFGVAPEELVGTSRSQRFSWPRQVAMYLARELTEESLPAIGRAFGDRDHTTVIYACKRTSERMAQDPDAFDAVHSLTSRLS